MSQTVTNSGIEESRNVTKSHEETGPVRNCHSVPYRTVPNRADKKHTAHARDDSFDLFWETYNIKTHKAETIVLWGKLTKTQKTDVMTWLEKRIEVEAEAARDGWFCPRRPNPATLLRRKRWTDEIPSAPKGGGTTNKTQHQRNLEILGLSEEDDGEREDSKTVSCDDIRIVPKI